MSEFFVNLIPQPRQINLRDGSMPVPRRLRLIPTGLDGPAARDLARLAKSVLRNWVGDDGRGTALEMRLAPARLA